MGDGHLVVAKHGDDERRAHAGVPRLTFGGAQDRGVDQADLGGQHGSGRNFAAGRQRLGQRRAQHHGGQAAGHFAGVVTAHAIGQDHQPRRGIAEHGILIVGAHPSGIGSSNDFQ